MKEVKQTQNLIGTRIIDLFERKILDLGGLDQGELFIHLETGEIISFPHGLDCKIAVIDESEMLGATSIFNEIRTNNADWRIRDIIELDHSESQPYIELQCGILFTEECINPHGTGLAGFRSFKDLEAFESFYGKDYQRLSEQQTGKSI